MLDNNSWLYRVNSFEIFLVNVKLGSYSIVNFVHNLCSFLIGLRYAIGNTVLTPWETSAKEHRFVYWVVVFINNNTFFSFPEKNDFFTYNYFFLRNHSSNRPRRNKTLVGSLLQLELWALKQKSPHTLWWSRGHPVYLASDYCRINFPARTMRLLVSN
jgi:hypothetical protein